MAPGLSEHLIFAKEVREALDSGSKPVVALESTIISHGMPYPQNVATARAVEDIIRKRGATPATIGILDGKVHVGMDDESLEKFGKTGPACEKVSRRDFARVMAEKLNGATTVAATMMVAHAAGIKVFVTGGVGGVHRGASETWDVSADMTELGRTPVMVVCAGVKSILDIPKTLEFLETQGVCVAGYGTLDFPAFFTPKSGLQASCMAKDAAAAARLLHAQFETLKLQQGIVLAAPVPAELAAEGVTVEKATKQGLQEAIDQKIEGRDVTPFLLKRINELTGGESLKANIALIKHNAEVGADVAKAWQDYKKSLGEANGSPPKRQRL